MGKHFSLLRILRQKLRMQETSLSPQTPMKHHSEVKSTIDFAQVHIYLQKSKFSSEKTQEKSGRLNK